MRSYPVDRHPDTPAEPSAELFDYRLVRNWLGFVLRSTRRHPLLAAACFLSIAGLSIGALLVMPFQYQVQATVLAIRTPMMGALSNPGLNREWDLPTRAAREAVLRRDNLVDLCKDTNFAERYLRTRAPAVRALHWLRTTVTGKSLNVSELQDGLVDSLQQRLWVNVNSGEGTVAFTFQWSDPEIAYDMVNAAVLGFLEARHASEISAMSETIEILRAHDARILGEVASVTKELEEKERAIRNRGGAPRRAPPPTTMAPDEEGTRLRAQLAARRRALVDVEDFRQRRLLELQAQLAQQIPIYAPQHPTMVTTRQAIEALNSPSPQVRALQAEIKDLEAQVTRRGSRLDAAPASDPSQQLQAELTEARLRLAEEDPRLELERSHLRLLLRQHSNLLERIDAASVEMDTARAAFKYRYAVTSPPQMPRGPVKPKPLFVVLGGLLGGVAFALFACTFIDLRSGRVVESWQVEHRLALPLLAELKR